VTADELAYLTLVEIRDLLRKGEVTAVELAESQLDRLERLEPDLNAFITVTRDEALEAARSADDAVRRGESLGPLHGVPFTLKDLFWTKGVRTTSGSKVFADFIPEKNATVVDRLLGAGAVLMGKTNLHELAYGVTCVNPHYGPVRNPWDRDRIAGGSSGGSAAALGAGIGYGSVGSDTGGSIRIPSALCGTVGLKPTYGRVSRYGATPLSWSLDHIGPMTRTVKDAAVVYDIMVGHDPKDSASHQERVEAIAPRIDQLPSHIKMGIPEKYFFERIEPEVEELVRTAIGELEGLGMRRDTFPYEQSRHLSTCRNVIAFTEASTYHETTLEERPQDFGPGARELLRLGLTVQGTEYLKAQRARRRLVELLREAFRDVDFIVSPMTPAPAPKIVDEQFADGEDLRAGLLRLAGPFNAAGFPALALPCGFTRSGLPVGMQLVGRPFEEDLLLKVGHAYEVVHPWRERHPI
jgi:aspartyl-tRNA(Asn)/glutamyl-tRNA(Gln) amidotransferase subunit A